jgi:hypothetical protein
MDAEIWGRCPICERWFYCEGWFDRDVPDITRAWRSYTGKFMTFAAQRPERTALVRYEDLVVQPREVLEDACKHLEIDFDETMLHFFDSKTEQAL